MQAADPENQDIEQRIASMKKAITDFRQRCTDAIEAAFGPHGLGS